MHKKVRGFFRSVTCEMSLAKPAVYKRGLRGRPLTRCALSFSRRENVGQSAYLANTRFPGICRCPGKVPEKPRKSLGKVSEETQSVMKMPLYARIMA